MTPMSTMTQQHPTVLTLRFQRRPGTEHARGGITSAEYDIAWPDGRPVQTGLSRFCNFGSRLLLGRRYAGGTTLVHLTVHPVAGLEAALTRPGGGAHCRRLYAVRRGDTIRLHFLDGTPTEAVFHAAEEEAELRTAEAQLTEARKGPELHASLVAQQRAALEAARHDLAAARLLAARRGNWPGNSSPHRRRLRPRRSRQESWRRRSGSNGKSFAPWNCATRGRTSSAPSPRSAAGRPSWTRPVPPCGDTRCRRRPTARFCG
jgi:hypothetical protein